MEELYVRIKQDQDARIITYADDIAIVGPVGFQKIEPYIWKQT